jgi:hypothetical protein
MIFDAFWRAAAYCLHPKVIALSLAPLLLVGGATFVLGWVFWEPAIDAVRGSLESWSLLHSLLDWLRGFDGGRLLFFVVPIIVVALAIPVFVVVTLIVVALLMTPAMVRLVALRRFPLLERRLGGGFWQGFAWSLACAVAALAALVLSVPLWFIPPLVLVVPPLIWGWLTYRVFAYDVLALHASSDERRQLIRTHRLPLLGMGVVTGFIGAAPSLLWAASAMTLVFAPLLILVSIWLYTLVFAFSSLWFAHYLLAALRDLRNAATDTPAPVATLMPAPVDALRLPPGPAPDATHNGITA